MRLLKVIGAIVLAVSMFGCGSVDIQEYRGSEPKLVLEEFFQGKLTAAGVVQDFSGKVVRKFNVTMDATWQGNQLTLDEDFVYDDGEIQKRIWVIESLGNGKYTGTAGDILGQAEGEAVGSALRWKYDMILPVDGSEYQVTFDDWMFLVNDNTIINRSDIIKFGITVAQVTLVIEKN
ncbi:DUF3833 domain-containing protein [Shewanella submarina]|uniref:DUF3833 domain-containing protein n=1 Tax=Shewanella submarina TaxID=2016376 RepID=A0ABV7G7U2_9GAMM|nr:DUF3833 domain-containing protein [Shewanella submarina]MCL1037032.1 DUF3833 domain-containing protein [Shewanella submarina]